MRRADREITEKKDLLQIIKDCDVCRLAISAEPVPYILPLNFGWEERDGNLLLYFHGATEGTKYDLLRKQPLVSFEMDCSHRLVLDEAKGHCTMEYRSVIGSGMVSLVTDEAEKLRALQVLMRHYRDEAFPFNPAALPRTTVLQLTVQSMTGKQRML